MEVEFLEESLKTAQMIDQFSAKGVMALMLFACMAVCFFLIRRIFIYMDGMKSQIELLQRNTNDIEKLKESTQASIEICRETIKENKATLQQIQTKIATMDEKYSNFLSHCRTKQPKGISDEY